MTKGLHPSYLTLLATTTYLLTPRGLFLPLLLIILLSLTLLLTLPVSTTHLLTPHGLFLPHLLVMLLSLTLPLTLPATTIHLLIPHGLTLPLLTFTLLSLTPSLILLTIATLTRTAFHTTIFQLCEKKINISLFYESAHIK